MRNSDFPSRTLAAGVLGALAYSGYDTGFASPSAVKAPAQTATSHRMQRSQSTGLGVVGAGAVAACAAAAAVRQALEALQALFGCQRVPNSPLAKHGMGFLDHLGCVCKQRSESNPSSFKEAVKEERSGAEPVERRATGTDVRTLAPSRLEEADQSLKTASKPETDKERYVERSLDSTSKASIEGEGADSKEIQGKTSTDSKGSGSESPSNSSVSRQKAIVTCWLNQFALCFHLWLLDQLEAEHRGSGNRCDCMTRIPETLPSHQALHPQLHQLPRSPRPTNWQSPTKILRPQERSHLEVAQNT
eukprot:symbB.v1.2.024774.t3/scaffold2357.1/size81458/5